MAIFRLGLEIPVGLSNPSLEVATFAIQSLKMKQLFEVFPSVSKADWLEKIKKDLKGKDIADFDWQVSPTHSVSAFPHVDEFGGVLPHSISEGRNEWQIGEYIITTEKIHVANNTALKALQGGAEVLHFEIQQLLLKDDLSNLFQDIQLSFVPLHFHLIYGVKAVLFLQNLSSFFLDIGLDAKKLTGVISWVGERIENDALEIIDFSEEFLPNFKILPVRGNIYFTGDENTAGELNRTIKNVQRWHDVLTVQNISPEILSRKIFFKVAIGKNYFLQIAKIRALRKFWLELQRKWGIENPQPSYILAEFPLSQHSPDANTNLVQATTQAMSGVIGGVDVLTVLPSDMTNDDGSQPTDFSRRMARNVQHILRMESHFDWVADPAAGSYFIENLTEQLLEGMRFEMLWT